MPYARCGGGSSISRGSRGAAAAEQDAVGNQAMRVSRARRTLVSCRPRQRSQCHRLIPVTHVTNVKRLFLANFKNGNSACVIVSLYYSYEFYTVQKMRED